MHRPKRQINYVLFPPWPFLKRAHLGESQSNGAVERATRSIEDHVRTMKHVLEERIGAKTALPPSGYALDA